MVKADIKRDYYADLGLDPKAEEDEIRKKYRKLALKFHPDRNPGKELEFNAKFQAIQAAYEILTDPKERLKYDTGRLRAGYGKFYGPPRTSVPPPRPQYAQPNHSQPRRAPTPATHPRPTPNPTGQPRGTPTPGTQPRRPSEPNAQHHPQGFPHPGSYPIPPSAGAPKYTSYAKATSQKWDKTYEDTRTRADAFRGFQEMNPNPNPGEWSRFDPRTGRSNQSASTPQPSQRTQSAYEAYFNIPKPSPQRAQAKKKQGFAPGTPGGDEPMAPNTSAYTSFNRARTSYPQPHSEPAPPPTAKKWPRQEESTDTNIPNLQRTSSKYATAGGEKTYVSGAGLGRSSSTRNSPFAESDSRPRTNPPSPTSPQSNRGRHHSASPKLKPNRDRTFSSSPASSDSEEVDISSRPKRMPRSRMFAHSAKKDPMSMETDSGKEPLGWATHRGSWLFSEPHMRPDGAPRRNPRGRWNLDTDYEKPQGHHPINMGFNPRGSHGHVPAVKAHSQQAHVTANNPPNHAAGNPDNLRQSRTPDNSNNMYGPSHKSFVREWSKRWGFTSSTTPADTPEQSFPLWAYPSSILPQLSKPPKWSKEAGDRSSAFPNTDEILHDGPHPHMNPFNSTQMNQIRMNADRTSIPSFGPFVNKNTPLNGKPKSRSHESIDVTFSAADWNIKFQHAPEFFAPKPSRDQPFRSKSSRARGRSISRPNSATHPRPFPPPGSTNQTQKENINKSSSAFIDSGFSVDKWKEEVLKADIWSIPHNELPQQNPDRQKSPRKQLKPTVKRQPTIPKPAAVTTEAEEAQSTLSNGKTDEPKQIFPEGAEAMDIDEGIPASKSQQQHPAPPNTTTDTTSKPPFASAIKPTPANTLSNNILNLKNLAKVAPFTATNSTGINDLNDLSSTLPFESRPDDSSRTRLTVRPQDLALPKPPRVPAAPNFSGAEHPHKAEIQLKWERYVTEINAYMHDWNIFNRTMLGHFNARQQTVETGLAPNWASAVGDSVRLRINDGVDFTGKKHSNKVHGGGGGVQDGDDDGNDADDEQLVAGSAKGGFNAYMRGVKEDFVVRQHWEVAWERHLACLEALDATRRFMRAGVRNQRMSARGVVG
ncbi:curved DNA-binding protein [[Emmonsia] crescens]|uniref:Curved DNA-binding protein n=1 Tax=[Emmonsia] crescens TaxID=73230 RepID=A0A2B7ZSP1_9EURO|nr:curved DNA-binding protein [Emmonsia crescens]